MKKLIPLTAFALFLSGVSMAQNEVAIHKKQLHSERKAQKELKKLDGNEVSYMTKSQFSSDFDGIGDATWRRTENYDIASFVQDGVSKSAYYDANAKLVGTVEPRTFNDLPEKAQHYINKKWTGYEVMHVIYFDDNEWNDTDMMLYGEQFNDEDNYFIELGKGSDKVIVRSDLNGQTDFFAQVK